MAAGAGSSGAHPPDGTSSTIAGDVHRDLTDISEDSFYKMWDAHPDTRVGTYTHGAIVIGNDPTFVKINDNLMTTEQGAYVHVGNHVEYVSPTSGYALQISFSNNNLNISNVPVVSH
jgi:hypothetical protein